MRRTAFSLVLIILLFLAAASPVVQAQEHPREHPKEHPSEHPSEEAKADVTTESLADAIIAFVAEDAKLKGGFFLVYDPDASAPLLLTLDKVHKDKLATLGDGLYFACADFKTPEGKVYDLDIFMQDGSNGLQPKEVTVHKEDGKPRYGWAEKNGLWERVPVE